MHSVQNAGSLHQAISNWNVSHCQ